MANPSVTVADFKPGMGISVAFEYPSTARATVDLKDSLGNIILHMDCRVTLGQGKDLVLNSNLGNTGWGQEQVVSNFIFTPGTLLKMTARAQKDSFSIIANDKEVAEYSYRAPVDSIQTVSFVNGADAVLKWVSVEY